ncbi:DNA-directed RNA polymerase subunit alpha [Spiroplasma endosymbiont of Diplazon laetatorius]|uniref:DNA-directed RNA polymerase subunit alpha n=1 Tax=Spiroplasma endosymbiont of Diplazon laetatorius TaxID=3066322 RepID=UPI0030CFBD05
MKQFSRPEFNLLKEEKNRNYGEFKVEPLERGFGTTLGNAIRRTLLSSTPGAAVYAIKIVGAAHEFTSINGIVENVSRIILNLKKLALKIDSKIFEDDEVVELKINSTRVGAITAGDIVLPTGVEVMNPELHICTISDGGVLDLTLFAKNSRGYRSFKDNKKEKLVVDAITIDSNYSPIVKVAYNVDATKIGKSVDLEKLILEVETDGTVTASDAVATAAKILVEHLQFFVNLNEEINDLNVIGATNEEDEKELDRLIEDLDFTQRSLNCLKRANINSLRDLVSRTEDDIQEIRNLGRKSLKEIKDKVVQLGLTFKQD